jgi:hypothetical protein
MPSQRFAAAGTKVPNELDDAVMALTSDIPMMER